MLVAALLPLSFLLSATARSSAMARVSSSPRMELFASDGWPALEKQLDLLPTFACADAEGKPLDFDVPGAATGAVYYTHVEPAQQALTKARAASPDADLVPLGLGKAYRLACAGKATLLPSSKELGAAGAPPDASPVGQAVPLFACMEMCEQLPSGGARLPLFMSWADAKAAVDEASDTDQPDSPLEIVCLSLDKAI